MGQQERYFLLCAVEKPKARLSVYILPISDLPARLGDSVCVLSGDCQAHVNSDFVKFLSFAHLRSGVHSSVFPGH